MTTTERLEHHINILTWLLAEHLHHATTQPLHPEPFG